MTKRKVYRALKRINRILKKNVTIKIKEKITISNLAYKLVHSLTEDEFVTLVTKAESMYISYDTFEKLYGHFKALREDFSDEFPSEESIKPKLICG